MSEDALNRATRINDLSEGWQRKLAGQSTNTPLRLVDLLAANPFLTITDAASQLKLAFTTAQRAIGRLEQNGMVQQVWDAKRDRVYCARALLDILRNRRTSRRISGEVPRLPTLLILLSLLTCINTRSIE
jgi:hypothetical protein